MPQAYGSRRLAAFGPPDGELGPRPADGLGRGGKNRRIPIGKSAVHWLQRYLSVRRQFGNEGKPELFLHRGRPLTRQMAWSIIKAYALQVGVPDISPHTLRHSFGTHLMQHGA